MEILITFIKFVSLLINHNIYYNLYNQYHMENHYRLFSNILHQETKYLFLNYNFILITLKGYYNVVYLQTHFYYLLHNMIKKNQQFYRCYYELIYYQVLNLYELYRLLLNEKNQILIELKLTQHVLHIIIFLLFNFIEFLGYNIQELNNNYYLFLNDHSI